MYVRRPESELMQADHAGEEALLAEETLRR